MDIPAPDLDGSIYGFAEGRYGRFFTIRNDLYISRALDLYGEWCEAELILLKPAIRPGMVVVDAGANIGTHTMAFAEWVGPTGRVYAFEPQPVVHRALTANAMINGAWNVTPLCIALGDDPDTAAFAEYDYARQANFGGFQVEEARELAKGAKGAPRVSIPVERLDDVLDLPRLDLIKSDVEGMECALLRGAEQTIRRHQPMLYLEAESPDQAGAILEALEEIGYAAYWHVARMARAENWRGAEGDVFGGMFCVNLFAAPKGRSVSGPTRATSADEHPRSGA